MTRKTQSKSRSKSHHLQKQKGLGIRGKILLTFTIMALIPLVVIGFFTTLSINDLGDRSVEDSTSALIEQANSDLNTETSDKAIQAEQFFMDIEADGEFLMDFAYDVYNNPQKYEVHGYPDYQYSQYTVPYLPAWGYVHQATDERGGAWADWESRVQACPYLNSSVVNRASQDLEFAEWLRNEINLTLVFDQVFKPIYDNNQPNVVNVWMVRIGGLTNSYNVPPLDYGELLLKGDITDKWDEDAQDYVIQANPINNPQKKVVWTDPYFDPVGNGWMVSCIAPIYKGSEFIGTIGIDVKLTQILETVLDISMYNTGHAFLIDHTGNTIAHQNLAAIRKERLELDPENEDTDVYITELETDSEEFTKLLNKMVITDTGIESSTYDDGKKYYVGYEKILGTNFILGIVVPEEEVIDSVKETKKKIEDTTQETWIRIIIIDAIALIFILGIGLGLANRIIGPINEMIQISHQLAVGEIDENLFRTADSKISKRKTKGDEIGTLFKSFSKMVHSINQNIEEEKKQKQKESAPIPQQLVQDIKIEIRDSVIHRSNIGAGGQKSKPGQTQYCLNCGKDLPTDFSGEFCPYCGEEP